MDRYRRSCTTGGTGILIDALGEPDHYKKAGNSVARVSGILNQPALEKRVKSGRRTAVEKSSDCRGAKERVPDPNTGLFHPL